MDWKESKLRVVVLITLAMLADAVLVLWPLGVVLACSAGLFVSVPVFVAAGISLGLQIVGIVGGDIYYKIVRGLVSGIVVGLGISIVLSLGINIVFSLSLGDGIAYGFICSVVIGLVAGLMSTLSDSLKFGLVNALGVSLINSFFYGLVGGLVIFAGVFPGILICRMSRELSKSGIKSVKRFFTPWRPERLYFGRSVGFFVMLYVVFVLLFALWFYASYLNAARELPTPTVNSYFKTQDISPTSNFWTFVYFSFITIASLGYGDIYPTHWFSQILVIAETMIGVGLIAGFLALIMNVGGRGKAKQVE